MRTKVKNEKEPMLGLTKDGQSPQEGMTLYTEDGEELYGTEERRRRRSLGHPMLSMPLLWWAYCEIRQGVVASR